jgi:hypothetical protein
MNEEGKWDAKRSRLRLVRSGETEREAARRTKHGQAPVAMLLRGHTGGLGYCLGGFGSASGRGRGRWRSCSTAKW